MCKAGKLPKTNYSFWKNKIDANIVRDLKNINELQISGWKVIIIWQCEIKNKTLLDQRMNLLIHEIKGQD